MGRPTVSDRRNRIADITVPDLTEEQSKVIQALMLERGRIPTPFKIWLHSPKLAGHLNELGSFLADGTSLNKRETEIAILMVAAHWQADYVFAMHRREALEAGLPEHLIDAIRRSDDAVIEGGKFGERERAIQRIVQAFIRAQPVSDELFALAVSLLGHSGLADLLACCGYFTSVALATKLYRVS